MKTIVLSVLLAIVLIQVVNSQTTAKSLVKSGTTAKAPVKSGTTAKSPVKSGTTAKAPLRCHVCEMPEGCKRHNEKDCASSQDTCVKIHRPIVDPSGTENKNNYYAKYNEGIMVWGRGCSTKVKCEKEKQKKMKGNLKITVECCHEPLCNP